MPADILWATTHRVWISLWVSPWRRPVIEPLTGPDDVHRLWT
jgi:hypothetical protein